MVRGHPCLVHDLSGKGSSFSPLSIKLVVGFLESVLIKSRKFPSIPNVLRFIMNGCCILSNAFSTSIDKIT